MKYRFREVSEEEYVKEMMRYYEIRCKEAEIKEEENMMKNERHEEVIKKRQGVYSFASFFYERTYSYHSKMAKNRAINSGGLTKEDYDLLDNMRKNDPNMFDRMAVK